MDEINKKVVQLYRCSQIEFILPIPVF